MPPKRKRTSDGDSQNDHGNKNTHTNTTTINKRNSNARDKRYAYLKPHVRQVPERTIKSKWSTLPDPVQDKVRDMFRALERPVIVRHQNERKRIEAQAAVQAVVKKYARILGEMCDQLC